MLASTVFRTLAPTHYVQQRGVTVLKRFWRMRQPKFDNGELHKNINTRKMKTYEIVEHTEVQKLPPLKVVLKELVEGIGTTGDVVEVRRNFARFKLIPFGRAVYATPENLEWAAKVQESGEKFIRYSSRTSPSTIRFLKGRVYALIMSEKNPWTLEKWHVRSHLRSQGLIVPEEAITLPDEPIHHDAGVFDKDIMISIKINGVDEARCRLRFRCAEYLLNPATQLLEVEKPWYIEPPIALLESQAEEVERMHEEVMRLFNERVEAIRNEGLKSITDLNTRALF